VRVNPGVHLQSAVGVGRPIGVIQQRRGVMTARLSLAI
jgi:hypothetical protein